MYELEDHGGRNPRTRVGGDCVCTGRVWINNGTLAFERKIANVNATLWSAPYDPSQHGFVRIAHVGTDVVFSTSATGSPRSWTVRYAAAWNTAAIPLSSIKFELKEGSSGGGGYALFDNFVAERP